MEVNRKISLILGKIFLPVLFLASSAFTLATPVIPAKPEFTPEIEKESELIDSNLTLDFLLKNDVEEFKNEVISYLFYNADHKLIKKIEVKKDDPKDQVLNKMLNKSKLLFETHVASYFLIE